MPPFLRPRFRAVFAGLLLSAALASGCGEPATPGAPAAPASPTGSSAPAAAAPAPGSDTPAPPPRQPAPTTEQKQRGIDADRAADGEPPPLPAAQPNGQAYIPAMEFRINRVGTTLPALKAFLDQSIPMVSALVMGEIYPVLVHTAKLEGLDPQRGIHLVLYVAPRDLKKLGAAADDPAADNPAPARPGFLVEYVPIADQQQYLDAMEEEVDEIKKQGDYRTFQLKKLQRDITFKFAGGYAVFADSLQGVDYGVSQVAQVAAGEAAAAKDAAAVAEFRPHEFFKAIGLQDAATRRHVIEFMVQDLLQSAGPRQAQRAGDFDLAANPAEARKLFNLLFDAIDQAESMQLYANVAKEAVTLGWNVQAVKGSALADRLARIRKIDPAGLHAPAGANTCFAVVGSADPLLADFYRLSLPFTGEKQRPIIEGFVHVLDSLAGRPYSGFAGFNPQGHIVLAAQFECNQADDTRKLLDQVSDLFNPERYPGLKNAAIQDTLAVGEEKTEGDWTLRTIVSTRRALNENGEAQLARSNGFAPNPSTCVLLRKGVVGLMLFDATEAEALQFARDLDAGKAAAAVKPEFAAWLQADAQRRGAVGYQLTGLYPIVQRVLKETKPDPKLAALAQNTLGDLNPLVFAGYVHDDRLELEFRLEAETVKQCVAFGLQAQLMLDNQHNGPGGPPPPPPGQGTDF